MASWEEEKNMYIHIYVYIENNNTDGFQSASTEFGQSLAMLVTIAVRQAV